MCKKDHYLLEILMLITMGKWQNEKNRGISLVSNFLHALGLRYFKFGLSKRGLLWVIISSVMVTEHFWKTLL